MTIHTRFTPPFIPSGGAATATVFTTRMVELLFNLEQGRRKAALDAWENEGGRVAAETAQEPFSIVWENGPQGKLMPRQPHGAHAVRNAFNAADSVRPDVAGQSSRARVCPRCNAPMDRVQRRIVDRVRSWISPVHRYRCRMKGWSCDWEGNLRTKCHSLPMRGLW
jgi:hypothetical protein